MCRLALLNNNGIDYIDKRYKGGLLALFNHLEDSLGGHGNGVAIVTYDGEIIIEKGVYLSNKDIVKIVRKNQKNIKWLFYHTRLASRGTVTDLNCHPFDYGKQFLAMNGTEKVTTANNYTDTETIFMDMMEYDLDIIEETKQYNSVFIGYNGKKVFANKNIGKLETIKNKDGAVIFASEYPTEYYKENNIYVAPMFWRENETVNFKKLTLCQPKTKTWFYNSYKQYAWMDDDEYIKAYAPKKYRP